MVDVHDLEQAYQLLKHFMLSLQPGDRFASGNRQRLGGKGMEFRLLSPDDLALVTGMEGDFRSGFIVEESARRFLCNPQNLLFAAITDSRVVGFAYGYRHPRLDGQGDKVYIHEVGCCQSGSGRAWAGACWN